MTAAERAELERVAWMGSERADRVARARVLLAAADGSRFTEAARAAGRRSGDAVGWLVARCNREGLAAVDPHHGGGLRPRYGAVERRSGLGLAISRHFCRLMRGDPSVESERIRTGLHLRRAAATRRWLHDTAEELVPMAAPGPDVTPGHWPLTRFDRCRRHDHGAAIVDSL